MHTLSPLLFLEIVTTFLDVHLLFLRFHSFLCFKLSFQSVMYIIDLSKKLFTLFPEEEEALNIGIGVFMFSRHNKK